VPSPRSQPADSLVVPPGLAGVAVTDTTLGDVRGHEGFYHYRQYSAVELAWHRGVEDVWHLLVDGDLPTHDQLLEFRAEVAPLRRLAAGVAAALPAIVETRPAPLDGLRTAVSLAGAANRLRPVWDLDDAARRRDALTVAAQVPTLLAAMYRLARGQTPIEPRDDLSYTENYLYMLTGAEPDPRHARAIERYQVSTIEHGFNSSTFTARVIASTGADLAACVVGAIGALSGPLHGGAPSRALELLDAIGTVDRVEPYIRAKVEAGERIMGFGHAVYRTYDPRSAMLRETATDLGGDLAEFAVEVERRVDTLLAELKPGRELHANVEYYAGVVMELSGIPREMFTPTFACSRVIGWCAHVLEQARERKIIRPAATYVGPAPPQPLPPIDDPAPSR
jgi:citrate synthase